MSSPTPPMIRAIDLARGVKGRTSPNPAVGAVIVKDGEVVGEGATLPYGQPHAEPVALRAAGERARGATMYVTLEPCSHFGRTPPCTNAIVESGIAAVHVATLDPNPQVAGRGVRLLHEAGIDVGIGDGAAEARAVNEDFACWITTGRPWVIAKFGASLDGRTATHTGESRWITGPEARLEVHRTRDRVDAILVGVNTVLSDDPELTTRLPGAEREPHHPWRLVLDSAARTPRDCRLVAGHLPGRTAIVTTPDAPAAQRDALAAAGAEMIETPAQDGRVALEPLLAELGRRKVTSLLVEGGATVHGAFFDAGLVDYVMAFIAPRVIGGRDAPGAVHGRGAAALNERPPLLDVTARQIGVDTLVAGYVRRAAWPEVARL